MVATLVAPVVWIMMHIQINPLHILMMLNTVHFTRRHEIVGLRWEAWCTLIVALTHSCRSRPEIPCLHSQCTGRPSCFPQPGKHEVLLSAWQLSSHWPVSGGHSGEDFFWKFSLQGQTATAVLGPTPAQNIISWCMYMLQYMLHLHVAVYVACICCSMFWILHSKLSTSDYWIVTSRHHEPLMGQPMHLVRVLALFVIYSISTLITSRALAILSLLPVLQVLLVWTTSRQMTTAMWSFKWVS